MYIPDFNIAIECDEYGHRRYNQDDEQKRSCIITAKLNCKFVRFDPFHVSFNIGDVISDILEIIQQKIELEKLAIAKIHAQNERYKYLLEMHQKGIPDPFLHGNLGSF